MEKLINELYGTNLTNDILKIVLELTLFYTASLIGFAFKELTLDVEKRESFRAVKCGFVFSFGTFILNNALRILKLIPCSMFVWFTLFCITIPNIRSVIKLIRNSLKLRTNLNTIFKEYDKP